MKLQTADFVGIDKRLIKIESYLNWLNTYLQMYDIVTWQRLSIFLAQCFHECDFLEGIEEYASGTAYEGRTDLGNTVFGYGVKYKGRGLIHVTGYVNYLGFTKFANSIGIMIDFTKYPELLKEPQFAVLSAVWYWNNKNLNAYADRLDFESITRIVNGGLTHINARKQTWEKTLKICRLMIAA